MVDNVCRCCFVVVVAAPLVFTLLLFHVRESGFRKNWACGSRIRENFTRKIWNPGLWNPEDSSRNSESSNEWNPESKFY